MRLFSPEKGTKKGGRVELPTSGWGQKREEVRMGGLLGRERATQNFSRVEGKRKRKKTGPSQPKKCVRMGGCSMGESPQKCVPPATPEKRGAQRIHSSSVRQKKGTPSLPPPVRCRMLPSRPSSTVHLPSKARTCDPKESVETGFPTYVPHTPHIDLKQVCLLKGSF